MTSFKCIEDFPVRWDLIPTLLIDQLGRNYLKPERREHRVGVGEKVFLQLRRAQHWIRLDSFEMSSQEALKHRLSG